LRGTDRSKSDDDKNGDYVASGEHETPLGQECSVEMV
jgi:hypothetical protein